MNLIDSEKTIRAIVAGVAAEAEAGESFWEALQNYPPGGEWASELKVPGGLALCYAASEGLPAILRAYGLLRDPVSPAEFATTITQALQHFAEYFPEAGDNLCYAHFLLHGLPAASAKQVAEKIEDNGRIIFETEAVRQSVIDRFVPDVVVPGYILRLGKGHGDDYQGMSMHLDPLGDNCALPFAKIGFFLDCSNSTAVVINVQGRKVVRSERDPEERKRSQIEGREYARLSARLAMDPRQYVLERTMDFLWREGVDTVLAIRPEEHVMAIGKHRGFRANYEALFEQAGMKLKDRTYFVKSAPPAAFSVQSVEQSNIPMHLQRGDVS